MKHYDLIIIGSGSGLMVLEAALAKGLSCAIVEQSKFGGTCLTRGCIPSKMLVYPADLIREAAEGGRVGIRFGAPSVDWGAIAARMWEQIDHSVQIGQSLRQVRGLDVYQGTGEFTGPDTLRVSFPEGRAPEEIRGRRFVVAAGARSFIPPIRGLEETGYVTSETFFGDRFPSVLWKRLAIVGGGAIGAEFAHIFASFGCKVTVVEMKPHLISTEEEEISVFVERQFARSGIEVLTGQKVLSAERRNGEKILLLEDAGGKTSSVTADEIFIASGVRSNTDLLKAGAAGIAMDSRGWIITDEYLGTSAKHIFAIGDINGKYQFRHKANVEAEILIHNLFSDEPKRKVRYDAVPWAIFTWPQVGHAGMTEREAREKGLRVRIGTNSYAGIAAGIAMGCSEHDGSCGFVKIIAGEDRRLLGAHVVGPQAAALVQPFVYLMNAGCPCGEPVSSSEIRAWNRERRRIRESCGDAGTLKPVMDSMVIHPSLNELTAWALESIDWNSEE